MQCSGFDRDGIFLRHARLRVDEDETKRQDQNGHIKVCHLPGAATSLDTFHDPQLAEKAYLITVVFADQKNDKN
jgi:hypothetical protein